MAAAALQVTVGWKLGWEEGTAGRDVVGGEAAHKPLFLLIALFFYCLTWPLQASPFQK